MPGLAFAKSLPLVVCVATSLVCGCASEHGVAASERPERGAEVFGIRPIDATFVAPEPPAPPADRTAAATGDRGPSGQPAAAPTAGRDEPDALATERELREELAAAADPTAAAVALAALLCGEERHREALAALDVAVQRVVDGTVGPDRERAGAALRVARAGVLRDLGRRHLAVVELRQLVAAFGAAAMHPALLFELAELLHLEGEPAAASAVLAESERVHAQDPWHQEHREDVTRLAAELARGSRPARLRLRDVFGNLRGAPAVDERVRSFEQIVFLRVDPGSGIAVADGALAELRVRAIATALDDESGVVRARAVQLAEFVDGAPARAFCELALRDPDPFVRAAAAARTRELLGPAAADLLLDRLDGESDPGAFASLHAALAALLPDAPRLPLGGAAQPEVRTAVVKAWKQRWPR